ncbi:hypothetical protein [Marilutibacter maris]|uniref:Uncharacterized protein n=1 Tax=Marilutibacter maris TaxID=1605891 RepID=A0A2U9TAH3_9GAMM|nr:hypothetical protein [Lysobacter maris]AWV08187.1 hypothetical protein C9I47_2509 [Lysobacter maris]
MIYFATSRESYDRLAASAVWPPATLWVSLGVLAPSELAALRAMGMTVTDFTHSVDPDDADEMAEALATIREHHPGQAVWADGSIATWQ